MKILELTDIELFYLKDLLNQDFWKREQDDDIRKIISSIDDKVQKLRTDKKI